MAEDKKDQLETLKAVAKLAAKRFGAKSVKKLEELPFGGIAHEISVFPVTRRVKMEKTDQGEVPVVHTEIRKTGTKSEPLIRWMLCFQSPQGMLGFVQYMNQQFSDLGFFVKDHRRYPLLDREQYPDLRDELMKQLKKHNAVPVREDRIALHARCCIVKLDCGHLPLAERGSVEYIAQNMLFAFNSLQDIKEFMVELNGVYQGKILLRVVVDQTPNLRPVGQGVPQAQGGGGGGGFWTGKWFGLGGGGGAQGAANAAVNFAAA